MNNQENNTTDWLFEITPKILLAEPQGSLEYRDLLMLCLKQINDF
jgi:hypothetical protein